MKATQQCISKGYYKYSQLSVFISVKNYMFLRKNNKKCLLLRFSNDMEYPVEAMAFTIVQLDSDGKILTQTNIQLKNLNFASGGTYTMQKAIVVDEYCSDFKIIFKEAYSGLYKYKVKDGNVIAYYLKPRTQITEGAYNGKIIDGFTVKPRRFGKPKLAVLVSAIIVLAIIILNLYNMFAADFVSSELLDNDRYKSVITSEELNGFEVESKSCNLR